mgnify:CR=1 FL=1
MSDKSAQLSENDSCENLSTTSPVLSTPEEDRFWEMIEESYRLVLQQGTVVLPLIATKREEKILRGEA